MTDGGECLFIINGLGLGNSTRCHAIIEHLTSRGVRIHILTSGNGLAYFSGVKGIASLSSMASFFYSGLNRRVSGWRTFPSLPALHARASAKKRQLEALLPLLPIDLAVTDSEYVTSPLRRHRIPVIGLNNSDVVVSEYLKCPNPPVSIRSHFWLVEFMDYLFHRCRCDLVIVALAERPPDFVDRHLHVHQFPGVREGILQFLATLDAVAGPHHAVLACVMVVGALATTVVFAVWAYRRAGRLPFRWPDRFEQRQQPWRAIVAMEWATLIAVALLFGPQTNSRHLVMMTTLATLAVVMLIKAYGERGRMFVLTGTVLLWTGLTLPPAYPSLYAAETAWHWIGGPAWVMLAALPPLLWGGFMIAGRLQEPTARGFGCRE